MEKSKDKTIIVGNYGNGFHSKNVYDSQGLSPTITTGNHGLGTAIATKEKKLNRVLCDKLVQEGKVKEGDIIRHSYSSNRLENGDKNMRRTENHEGLSPTLDTRWDCLGIAVKESGLRIRKLTPLECIRLMGFTDEDYEAMRSIGMSDQAIYHMAGDSIVVTVLISIFSELMPLKETNEKIINDYIAKEIIESKC